MHDVVFVSGDFDRQREIEKLQQKEVEELLDELNKMPVLLGVVILVNLTRK